MLALRADGARRRRRQARYRGRAIISSHGWTSGRKIIHGTSTGPMSLTIARSIRPIASRGAPALGVAARRESRRRVFELLRAQRVDLLALLRGRIVDREDFDSLADIGVERLRGALVDVNLVSVFKAQDDVRILLVRVLLADLLGFWGHRA